MIDVKDLITNKDKYLNLLKRKNFLDLNIIDKVEEIYKQNLILIHDEEKYRQSLNRITIEIEKNTSDILLKEKAKEISGSVKFATEARSKVSIKLEEELLKIPNIPLDTVPIGINEKDNVIIGEYNQNKIKNITNKKPHWDILEEKELILKDESISLSGRRHVVFIDKAALMIKALQSFMLDSHYNNGYKIIDPPEIVNERMLINTGQLPNFEDDLFKVNNGQFLIPTAEVPLTNLVNNKILEGGLLPIKYAAFTNCFRNERVAASQDSRGIIRLFQFRKVEIVKIGKRENFDEDFNGILNDAIHILELLQLPYRLLELSTGDLSFSSKKTIDIEVYMPGVGEYREISSVSFFGDFQARRMKTRYKNDEGSKEIPFTYNASALAIERTFAAIIENYLNDDGDVIVPEVLKKYLPFDKF